MFHNHSITTCYSDIISSLAVATVDFMMLISLWKQLVRYSCKHNHRLNRMSVSLWDAISMFMNEQFLAQFMCVKMHQAESDFMTKTIHDILLAPLRQRHYSNYIMYRRDHSSNEEFNIICFQTLFKIPSLLKSNQNKASRGLMLNWLNTLPVLLDLTYSPCWTFWIVPCLTWHICIDLFGIFIQLAYFT